jgi:3-deoxy-D-manno-octulosonic acid kinase
MRHIISSDRRVEVYAPESHADRWCARGVLGSGDPATWPDADRSEYHGRGRPVLVRFDDGSAAVVKTLRHGGLLGELLGDRFLGARRLAEALELGALLRANGVPAPEVVLGRIRWRGPLRTLCSMDLGTVQWQGSQDLLAHLAGPKSACPPIVCLALGRAVRQLHDAGVFHADLNVKNVLVHPGAEPSVRLIDWEGSRLEHPLRQRSVVANLERLLRSCRKQGLLGTALRRTDLMRFLRGYEPDRAPRRVLWRSVECRYRRRLWMHVLGWRLARRPQPA